MTIDNDDNHDNHIKILLKKLPKHSKTAMEMSYLCSIEKQHTKHRSAMQQGVNAIAAHMSNHNSIYSKGTIVGIITDMCHCVKEAITEGNAVMLGIREILEVSSVTLWDAERV